MPEKITFQSQSPETPPLKREEILDLELLTDKEKEELNSLFTELSKATGPLCAEIRWQIAEKFGERIIPHLIEENKKLKKLGGYFPSVGFFDSLITEKTASMVLEAMKKGKVGIWEAAMGAAAGKEKTALGLAEILTNLKLAGNRSDHTRLLAALGEAKIDDVTPQIIKFYERLRNDLGYSRVASSHLKEYGNDLYNSDAYDIIRSLSWINGPKAKKAIERFASSGDKYIKQYAEQALGGKLYIGHPEKYKIKKPIPQPQFYNTKSDHDFKPETQLGPLPKSQEVTLSEQLVAPALKISFLEKNQEFQEKHQRYFQDYFNGNSGIFEFLGKMINNEEIKNWGDFPGEKRGDVLRLAVSLESLKVLLSVPNFKEIKDRLDALRSNMADWRGVSFDKRDLYDYDLQQCDSFLKDFSQAVERLRQEDFRLPESAGGFQLWHEGLKKARPVKPFTELLRDRLCHYFSREFFATLKGENSLDWVRLRVLRDLPNLFKTYRDVEDADVPIYKEAAGRLEKVAEKRPLVFYGRDADYFYYAVKAQRFGLIDNKKPRKVYINRILADQLRNPHSSENRERILAYLLQEKVSTDALHIDTGVSGSVPEAVIRALNPNLKPQEVNDRIKLLHSVIGAREILSSSKQVFTIESREHKYGEIQDVARDEKTGRLKVVYNKPNPWAEIEAWVINQAVIRNFAPRQEIKK